MGLESRKSSSDVPELAEQQEYDVSYKVLLIGDSGVGKTALIRTVMGEDFNPHINSTIGIDFVNKVFDVDGAKVQLQIWDTAGQERFRSMTKFHYRGTKGLMLVYDVTNKETFDTLDYWMDSVDKELDMNNKEPVPVYLIGNKSDLKTTRVVSDQLGKRAAESHFAHGFLETSARDGENVRAAFQQLAVAITEVFDPRLMTSYMTKEDRLDRDTRKLSQVFLTLERQQGVIKVDHIKKKKKCACS